MLTKQEERLIERAKALATLDLALKIESLYSYTGVPEKLDEVLKEAIFNTGANFYKRPLILLPLHRDWASLILDRKKTRECRLSFPSVEGPFTALIYETKQDGGRGLVVGEFICRDKDVYAYDEDIQLPVPAYEGDPSCVSTGPGYYVTKADLDNLCLSYEQLEQYGKGRTLYGWHIEDVQEYSKPRPLSHYYRPGQVDSVLTRPPQMYFEVLEVGEEIWE